MSAIGRGDWVECIGRTADPLVQPGSIFRVDEIVSAVGQCVACGDDHTSGLLFVGQPRLRHESGCWMSWCPCRFRPIYRPKSELIETLLRKANRPVKEDA